MRSILIVDDHKVDHDHIKWILVKHPEEIDILSAFSGWEAIELLTTKLIASEKLPDIIFIDIVMPEMTGLDFIKKLKTIKKLSTIPTVITSSSTDVSDIISSYELKANYYLTKPISTESVERVVNIIFKKQ